MTRKYIAYGSNLNKEQMLVDRCPEAKFMCKGIIKDYRLLFMISTDKYPLTIVPCKGYEVPVVIWEVSASDEHELDIREGFRKTPKVYAKETIAVETEGGVVKDAFAYVMRDKELGLPTEKYWNTCVQGYKDFGFDQKYLDQALEESKRYIQEHKEDQSIED